MMMMMMMTLYYNLALGYPYVLRYRIVPIRAWVSYFRSS